MKSKAGTMVRPLGERLFSFLMWQKSQGKREDPGLEKKINLIRHGGQLDYSTTVLTDSEWESFRAWQGACSDQQGNDCEGCGLKNECDELYDWVEQLNRNFYVGTMVESSRPSDGNPCVTGCSSPFKYTLSMLDVVGAACVGTDDYRHKKEMARKTK